VNVLAELTKTHLRVARLPLTAVEAIARPESDWAPARAFEGYEARLKELVGGLVDDEELLSSARVQRARLTQLDRADEKQGEAARQKRRVAQKKAQAKASVEREFDQREQANRRVEKAQRKAVAKKATAAKRAALAEEAAALSTRERAVQAKADAVALDRAVETTKAARKR
jgi:hypothetical protein